jgi:hypothetical protein
MPIHDWTRVSAGTFHDFHSAWITHLKEALNAGLLPDGYYAMSEQHAGPMIADVLTLRRQDVEPIEPRGRGGPIAVAESPPKTSRKMVAPPEAVYRQARRTLAIRWKIPISEPTPEFPPTGAESLMELERARKRPCRGCFCHRNPKR